MNPELTLELLNHFIKTALILSAPFLGTAIIVGTGVSILQSVTSISGTKRYHLWRSFLR